MKFNFLKIALLATALSAVSLAAPINCNAGIATISDVTSGAMLPDGCSVTGSGLTFSNFTVSTGAIIGINSATFIGNTVSLNFSIVVKPSSPTDIILGYKVTGTTTGMGFNVLGTPLTGITFTEIACSTQLCSGNGNVVYGNLSNVNGQGQTVQQGSTSYAPQSVVWIKKDINYNSANSVMTDFSNTHTVPEPGSMALLGSGLLGLGLFARRRKN